MIWFTVVYFIYFYGSVFENNWGSTGYLHIQSTDLLISVKIEVIYNSPIPCKFFLSILWFDMAIICSYMDSIRTERSQVVSQEVVLRPFGVFYKLTFERGLKVGKLWSRDTILTIYSLTTNSLCGIFWRSRNISI